MIVFFIVVFAVLISTPQFNDFLGFKQFFCQFVLFVFVNC